LGIEQRAGRVDVSGWRVRIDDEMIAAYTASGGWAGKTLWQCAVAYADAQPDKVLVIEGGRQQTVREVVDAAAELAAGLHRLGLRAGDVVSYQLPNWAEVVTLNLAACLAGLVCNPIVPIYREAEVRYILRDSRSKLFFVPAAFRGFDYVAMGRALRPELPEMLDIVMVRGEAASVDGRTDAVRRLEDIAALGRGHAWTPPAADPNAVKLVLYTSGTTGNPKGVLHTHNTLMSEERAAADYWRVTERDVVLMPSPVSHITGYLYALEMPFVARCSTVLMERWDAVEAARLTRLHHASLTVGATPFLSELVQLVDETGAASPKLLPSLRLFASGGAPVPPEIVRRARRSMPQCEVFRVYGSSESPTVSLGLRPGDDPELGAITDGRIVNNAVKLGNDFGPDAVAPGDEGEVTVRGPELMVGYTQWAQTGEAFDDEGWFHTGDLGFITHGDFLTISGRKKDLIIRGGENISAKEIEDVLHAHRGIRDAAIVAMPHERLGEGVCAFIVAEAGHMVDVSTVAAVLAAAGLAKQKYPERVELVEALPRTASGKVQKNLLRERIKAMLAENVD
jgi:acyl-CoA synthetase (AMP-forming)/AMP-acid ligase II